MKTFTVYLRDGRIATVHAETYRHEGNRYLFDRAGSHEEQFFVDSEVVGIFESGLDAGATSPLANSTNQLHQQIIIAALTKTHGKIAPAAKILGISRPTLYSKISQLGIMMKPENQSKIQSDTNSKPPSTI